MTVYKLTKAGTSSADVKLASGIASITGSGTIVTGLRSVEACTVTCGAADRVAMVTAIAGGTITVSVYRGHDAAADVTGLEAATDAVTVHYIAVGD